VLLIHGAEANASRRKSDAHSGSPRMSLAQNPRSGTASLRQATNADRSQIGGSRATAATSDGHTSRLAFQSASDPIDYALIAHQLSGTPTAPRLTILACSSARRSLSSRSVGKVVRCRVGASVPDWMAGARYEIIGSGRKEEIWRRSNRGNLHTQSGSPLITRTATSTG
jgi:hypothetical protein